MSLKIIKQAGYEYEYEERAAILEQNGMPKAKAEAQAEREIMERYKLQQV